MKLTTDIKPRKDGTVFVSVGGKSHVFKADESGMLVADIPDDAVGYLLDTGNFYPADEADIDAGIDAVKAEDGDEDAADEADKPKRGRKKKAE